MGGSNTVCKKYFLLPTKPKTSTHQLLQTHTPIRNRNTQIKHISKDYGFILLPPYLVELIITCLRAW